MANKKTTTKSVEKTKITEEKLQNLRKWNLRLAVLLALEAIAIVIIGTARTYPVTTQYLSVDALASEATGGESLAAATRHLFDIRLGWVVGLALLAFAAAYFAAATFYRKRYEARMQQGASDVRWLAWGVGGGILLASASLLSGIYELADLLIVLALTMFGGVAVIAAEEFRRRDGQKTRLSHLLCGISTVAFLVPVIMIAIAAGGALLFDGKVPAFVYGIYASLLALFAAVYWLTHLHMEGKDRWADAFTAERAYLVLGFVGASVIAWQMFAGALLP